MVVDGGNAESGKAMVTYLKTWFGPNVTLAHVVLTHSDADHATGLRDVLSELPVENLWLHIPWLHVQDALPFFKDKSIAAEDIKREYNIINDIVELALARGCTIREPFQGMTVGPFTVLSPTQYAYVRLFPQFDKTPDPDEAVLRDDGWWLGKMKVPLIFANLFERLVAKAQKWINESWSHELLRDSPVSLTSASNETSVVLYGDFGSGRRVLLTGDAGAWALTWAAEYAEAKYLPLRQFSFVQIPHHGSRRNVGPTILNRIVGPIQPENCQSRFTAFVSAPEKDDTHPRRIVLNAFIRRGGTVVATQGVNIVHYGGFAARQGYVDLTPVPFANVVEEYD